jgi:hypothetical protein
MEATERDIANGEHMNGYGSSFNELSQRFIPLDLKTLLAATLRKTGSEEFCDEECRKSLGVLLNSCNTDAGLSLVGQIALRQHLLELLETRSGLLEYWQREPAIMQQVIHPQIFITGLPKSGSTFLHRLLAQDPANRVPHMWEVMHPLPPPQRTTFDSDPRIKKADNRLRWLRWSHPALVKAHPVGATIPQECGAILGYSFESSVFLDMLTIPSYEAWLRSRDMETAYQFHLMFLKHLQWQCPAERWVLKSSDHLHALATLLKVYPEARFIFLHRYPPKVLQAACSQMVHLKGVFSRTVDMAEIGAYELQCLENKIQMMMEFRDSHPEFQERVVDIRYHELAADPLGTARAIYDRFALPLDHEDLSRMETFAASARGNIRPDSFSLGHFNLEAEAASPLFDSYCQRFGVEREKL